MATSKTRDQIVAAQNKIAGLNDELKFIQSINEKKNKSTLFSKEIEMVSYSSDGDDGTKMLAVPGSIRIFIGNANSSLLKKLRKAAAANDAKQHAAVMEEVSSVMTSRKLTDRKSAQKMILGADSLYSFRCGSKTILDGAILPYNDEISYLDIPYCGTPFPKKFPPIPPIILDEYCGTVPRPRPRFDALVVIHEPQLSAAEIGALKQIPSDMREMLLGGSTVAIGTSVWYVSAVALVAVAVMTATAGCASPGILRDLHINEKVIDKLGPMRTATELIAMREKAMVGKF